MPEYTANYRLTVEFALELTARNEEKAEEKAESMLGELQNKLEQAVWASELSNVIEQEGGETGNISVDLELEDVM